MDIFLILASCLLGGLILNIMPCVLSVIPLKVLNFVRLSEGSPRKRVYHSLIYSIGIVVSFLILGGFAVSIKLSGGAALFGLHLLGSAWLNGLLGLIMALLSLDLLLPKGTIAAPFKSVLNGLKQAFLSKSSNLAESPQIVENLRNIHKKLPYLSRIHASVQSKSVNLIALARSKGEYLSSFLHGCLTTAMGSACTGPILAGAMGLALAASPVVIMAAFGVAGIGMSLPYLLLAALPGGIKILPKPGRWVVYVEKVAGSMMILLAVWFLWLALF